MIDFRKKYANLINEDIPKTRLQTIDSSDIPSLKINIPDEYRKEFITREDGFVAQFCEEYDHTEVIDGKIVYVKTRKKER